MSCGVHKGILWLLALPKIKAIPKVSGKMPITLSLEFKEEVFT